mmetsp:Transcript_398/g.648  ORF Transcript_398/g.648 Transcript_398/m.648 type:complete len:786 (+) Transcript_398:133-2490(+)|eukprot:CAMPEP_0197515580 /NCGR_PEP_ID=MMETSP1318-20131121/671_1 /TAXON_ID=552666 /ORGANISM="Partenskyella glossopodia, Strain RCC365" /LENGTH=785 /DNA_ID=CAMNT_0043063995 /DNA_START=88 /DNA_END=2445 /DNA_ORIENTATION=+
MRLISALALCAYVNADIYLQAPGGSNNRNRERNNNRNNANRLFDSQNNGQGGYPFRGDPAGLGTADPITYYHGSELSIEWTAQHACGPNPNIHCELIIQYACDDGPDSQYTTMPALRDGYPTGACYDSSQQNPGNECEGTTCPNCQATEHWVSRKFQSARQNGQQQAGTNNIFDPTNRGNNQFGQVSAAERNAWYAAAEGVLTNHTFGNGDVNYAMEFGMHEDNKYFESCSFTERNKGLFTSDQDLQRESARSTRQNPNGNRRGLECPEERDYYPYWRPQPWKDLAILTSDIKFCDYFTQNSQNVQPTYFCNCTWLYADDIQQARNQYNQNQNPAQPGQNAMCPIDQIKCLSYGFDWIEVAPLTNKAPDCVWHPFSRDNHLGNALPVDEAGNPITPKTTEGDVQPANANYIATIPEDMRGKCVLRLRYNMSTGDYPSHQYAQEGGTAGVGLNGTTNCPWYTGGTDCGNGNPDCSTGSGNANAFQCGTALTETAIPLYNRPYVDPFNNDDGFTLGLAINTDQTGRTFQDRSFLFNVEPAPSEVEGKRIINLGLRGRRGNIVQAYPATEYDYTPSLADLNKGDYLHIQLHGSDFNAARNANNGEGWQFSDRTNLVQMHQRGDNYPVHHSQITMWPDTATAKKWAWVGQDPSLCDPDVNNDDNQNEYKNCGKLNMAPNRFPADPREGLVEMNTVGNFYYYSTRNNNFSNRSHKSQIKVKDGESDKSKAPPGGEVVVGVFGGLLGASLLGLGVAVVLKQKGLLCFAGTSSIGATPMVGAPIRSAPPVSI